MLDTEAASGGEVRDCPDRRRWTTFWPNITLAATIQPEFNAKAQRRKDAKRIP